MSNSPNFPPRPLTSKFLPRPITSQRGYSPQFKRRSYDPVEREKNRQLATEAGKAVNKDLNRRQQRFVAEMLCDPARNGTQAAIRAGYSNWSAGEMARINLLHPKIKALIAEADRKVFKKLDITAEKVIQEVAGIAFSNLDDFLTSDENGVYRVDLSKATYQQMAAVKDYNIDESESPNGAKTTRARISLNDKLAALNTLGKYLGVFNDKLNITNDGKPLVTINVLDGIIQNVLSTQPKRQIQLEADNK